MPGDRVAERLGVERPGDQPGCDRGDAVEDQRHPLQGGAEHEAGDRRMLEPADVREGSERVGRVRGVALERPPHDLDLVGDRGGVPARARAGDLGGGAAGEGGDQAGGRRGVADPHVAGHEQVRPGGGDLPGEVDAGQDRARRLLAGHRRARGQVGGAGAHLAALEEWVARKRGRDADIEHADAGPDGACQRALTAARSAQNSPTMVAVTSAGQADTPWASTPWSPAHTRTAGRSGTGGGLRRATEASQAPSSSSRPRLPGGFTSRL